MVNVQTVRKQLIPIKQITVDTEIQQRAGGLNKDTVADYVLAIQRKQQLPPVDVFEGSGKTWLSEGFHRIEAYKQAKVDEIECVVHEGGKKDAMWFACSANATHGLTRTVEDKRRAVATALKLKSDATDRQVAAHCGVSHTLVATVRKEMESTGTVEKSETRTNRSGQKIKVSKETRERKSEAGKKGAEKRFGPTKPKAVASNAKAEAEHQPQAAPPIPAPVTAQVNDGVVVDAEGTKVPDNLKRVFQTVYSFTMLVRGLRTAARQWELMAKDPSGVYLNPENAQVIAGLADVLEAATPNKLDDSEQGWVPKNIDLCEVQSA